MLNSQQDLHISQQEEFKSKTVEHLGWVYKDEPWSGSFHIKICPQLPLYNDCSKELHKDRKIKVNRDKKQWQSTHVFRLFPHDHPVISLKKGHGEMIAPLLKRKRRSFPGRVMLSRI